MTLRAPSIEPLACGQAWTRGDRTWRPHVSLREVDRLNLLELMAGTGNTEAAYLRYIIQLGIATQQCRAHE